MLAHELRNPLAAMQSSFELLNDPGDGEQSMRLARGVMDRQLKLLIRLVDDLLDIERLVRGKIALRRSGSTLPQWSRLPWKPRAPD